MKSFLSKLRSFFGETLGKLLISICSAVSEAFKYLRLNKQEKIKKEEAQKQKDFEEKVDKITKEGTIEDLLNLKR